MTPSSHKLEPPAIPGRFIERFRRSFGQKHLDEIEPGDIERYKTARLKDVVPHTDRPITPRTVNLELALLKRMFNLAINRGYGEKNPVTRVDTLKVKEKPRRILSPEEETKLLAAAPPHLERIITFALNTGLRFGEIVDLKWVDVNLKAGTFTVTRSKTDRVRVVPINKAVRVVLRDLGIQHGGYVFGYKGKHIQRITTSWRTAVRKAGIEPIRFHDLRGTFGTRLAQNGAHLIHIEQLMGHSRVETTMRYIHADEAFERGAVDSLCGNGTVTKLSHDGFLTR